jgi:hypothetical protein
MNAQLLSENITILIYNGLSDKLQKAVGFSMVKPWVQYASCYVSTDLKYLIWQADW